MPRPPHGGTGGICGTDATQPVSSTAECWRSASTWLTLPGNCGNYGSGAEHEMTQMPLAPGGVGIPSVGIPMLEADAAALQPLLEEVRQLRRLRIEVDLLWTHVRQLAERADERETLALPRAANRSSHNDETMTMQCLIRKEVSRVLLQDDDVFHDKLRTTHIELQQQLRETEEKLKDLSTVEGSSKLLPGIEGDICRLSADRREPSFDSDLDLGAPIGKTLNTQDWLALHANVKTEVQDCRAELVRLCRQVGSWSEATTKWAQMLPEGGPA